MHCQQLTSIRNVQSDTITLTNQPKTGVIPSPISSRALAEMDESKIFVFGRVVDGRAKLSKTKILTTMAV
eukprot:scaffold41047_cov67-Cyclotella_meneghiniana.AAC.3